jgi:hypothetical protein
MSLGGGTGESSSSKARAAHDPADYYELTVSRTALYQAVKTFGFLYTVPALVCPAQFLYGVHCVSGRLMVGSLEPGRKRCYPFEDVVEALPSMTAASTSGADAKSGRSGLGGHPLSLTLAAMGFGVAGVIFGGLVSLPPARKGP